MPAVDEEMRGLRRIHRELSTRIFRVALVRLLVLLLFVVALYAGFTRGFGRVDRAALDEARAEVVRLSKLLGKDAPALKRADDPIGFLEGKYWQYPPTGTTAPGAAPLSGKEKNEIRFQISKNMWMMEKRAPRAEWGVPRVVQIKGIERLCNYPPTWCTGARASHPVGVLARDGDLFWADKDHLFLYRGTDGESLVLDVQGDVLLLNGKAVSIQLSDQGTGWEWLWKASTEDLSDLRLLIVRGHTDAFDFPLLEKVARVRPDIALFLDERFDQSDIVAQLVSLFEPDFLAIDLQVLSEQFDALEPRLAKLEVLWALEEGPVDFLPRLPRLRTLLLSRWDPARSGGIPGSRSLRSVTIMNSRLEDLSFLRNVTGLQELVLFDIDELKDITALAAFPDLKKLVLFSKSRKVLDLAVLERLPKLAWLEFPRETSQEAFANVIASHPGLEVVVLGSEEIRDLSPLRGLRHLKAAILLQRNVDVGVLQDLKSLQYLALQKDAFEGDAAEKTAALEQALPKTFVTQTEPFCLGSGWILLLVPAIVLLRSLWLRGHGPRCEAYA